MDVTDATFDTDVLARSAEVPVVVDLWASWCGPCKTLGPILERVVAETGGSVALAKVDVDANPRIATTFQVQSIPAVFAIKDRKVLDSFVGALPEPAVRQWIAQILPGPSEVELLLSQGDESSLRQALELEPGNEKVVLALATLLVDQHQGGEALELLARIPETAEVRHVAALARVGDNASQVEGVEIKLDDLLPRVKADENARQEYLDLLELLGPADPRTMQYRKALTARLF